uniref:C-type lectin domain-containing protein n=1 Tax=Panagrolaimus sp. PS1159 TaxID=55785 RepID=A0AC35EZL7_9BILA
MSWHEAEKYCIQRKGHLVSTHNDAEFQFTQTNLTNTIIWIGLHSTDNCTTWEWTDESSFDFPKWVTNSSPVCNNQNSNTCIFEIVHGFANFNNCTHSLPGVCKMTQ